MGPPPLSGGRGHLTRRRGGARAVLQWGRRLSAAEGGALPRRARTRLRGFNGAAASQRRKAVPRARRAAWLIYLVRLQWGRRLSAAEGRGTERERSGNGAGFNGAAASQRRKASFL